MKKKFRLDQNSLEVCKTIVFNHPEITRIKTICHETELNWRQRYKTDSEKLLKLETCFYQSRPITRKEIGREEFLKIRIEDFKKISGSHNIWSFISKVVCTKGNMHIPMMNFHLEKYPKQYIVQSIKKFAGKKQGVLLNSGRFYHYYGDYLLNEKEWVKFMAHFLMPCIIVSPRYIGHRLQDGYCTLRLTKDKKYKPVVPYVTDIII